MLTTHQNEIVRIPIHETFQMTIQGEGYWAGTPVDFIRLAGCPVRCPWCDTGYADGGKHTPRLLRSLPELIAELRSPRVVISGGEPFIQPQLNALIAALHGANKRVSIETSGAVWQAVPDTVWVTLSPKAHVSRYPVAEPFWTRANEIKVVIATGTELEFYQPWLAQLSETPVCLQPEWNERDRTLPLILDLLKQHPHYRLSVQLHKLIGVK